MLGIARELARYNMPLVGVNQGRLGFITDIPFERFRETLTPMIAGDYEEEHRTMLEGGVWRDGDTLFSLATGTLAADADTSGAANDVPQTTA